MFNPTDTKRTHEATAAVRVGRRCMHARHAAMGGNSSGGVGGGTTQAHPTNASPPRTREMKNRAQFSQGQHRRQRNVYFDAIKSAVQAEPVRLRIVTSKRNTHNMHRVRHDGSFRIGWKKVAFFLWHSFTLPLSWQYGGPMECILGSLLMRETAAEWYHSGGM